MIEDFIDAVEHGRAPVVDGRTAPAAHRLIDAGETSSRSGVAVELAE